MEFFQLQRAISGVNPDIVFKIGGYPISNSTMLIAFVGLVFLFFSLVVIRKFSIIPRSRLQSVTEIAYEGVFGLIDQVTGDKRVTVKVFPIAAALFFYIITANLISTVLPGLTSITYDGISLFRTPTSDFNTTFGLALGAIILTHVVSIRDWGLFGHLGKFFQIMPIIKGFKKSASEGGMAIVGFFVGILDIVGEIAKVISLSLRLFGNLYAGEVLMVVIFGGLAYFLPAIWMAMSTLSGIVQAVVFCLLFTSYYTSSLRPIEDVPEEKRDL
ncbi:MAG: F0F1 ATP synthase subunit A [Candidatus Paceibacterota bacterium]